MKYDLGWICSVCPIRYTLHPSFPCFSPQEDNLYGLYHWLLCPLLTFYMSRIGQHQEVMEGLGGKESKVEVFIYLDSLLVESLWAKDTAPFPSIFSVFRFKPLSPPLVLSSIEW